jgi:DNA-binding GntR family transcriptional regulator
MDELTGHNQTRGRGGAGHVFMLLRDEIIALSLKPGTVLSRAELQERFGVSSTPVRDALMRLQSERLVEVYPQHATIVSPIDLDLARQAQFLRRSIEVELVRVLSAAPDAALVERLRSLIRQQEAFAGLGEFEAFTRVDQAFHQAFYDAAQVMELWTLVRRQSGHIDRLRRLNLPVGDKMAMIVREHTAVVDALARGDGAGAEAALRTHLSHSLQFVSTLRESYPDYFAH